MSRTISRIGVGIAAGALIAVTTFGVAGAAFADAVVPDPSSTGASTSVPATPLAGPVDPANPTDAVVASATTTFSAGNWGNGITATGTSFPVDIDVNVDVIIRNNDNGFTNSLGTSTVHTSASGDFAVNNWTPSSLPAVLTPNLQAFIVASYANTSGQGGPTFYIYGPELTITAFVPLTQAITVTPICSSPEGALADGVTVVATGFGQNEAITEATGTADGQQVGDLGTGNADATGTFTTSYTLTGGDDSTPIAAGNYTETVVGASGLTLSTTFTVGDCTVPAGDITDPATPALANTGSGDAGILVGGSALLLLVGGALVVARRRTATVK